MHNMLAIYTCFQCFHWIHATKNSHTSRSTIYVLTYEHHKMKDVLYIVTSVNENVSPKFVCKYKFNCKEY